MWGLCAKTFTKIPSFRPDAVKAIYVLQFYVPGQKQRLSPAPDGHRALYDMSAPAIIGGNFSVGLSHFTRLIKSEETQFVPSWKQLFELRCTAKLGGSQWICLSVKHFCRIPRLGRRCEVIAGDVPLEGSLSLELYYIERSFHSIRQSRITEGVDADELWSLSHVTQVVDEYVFGHGWPGKWLQNRIESGKK